MTEIIKTREITTEPPTDELLSVGLDRGATGE